MRRVSFLSKVYEQYKYHVPAYNKRWLRSFSSILLVENYREKPDRPQPQLSNSRNCKDTCVNIYRRRGPLLVMQTSFHIGKGWSKVWTVFRSKGRNDRNSRSTKFLATIQIVGEVTVCKEKAVNAPWTRRRLLYVVFPTIQNIYQSVCRGVIMCMIWTWYMITRRLMRIITKRRRTHGSHVQKTKRFMAIGQKSQMHIGMFHLIA